MKLRGFTMPLAIAVLIVAVVGGAVWLTRGGDDSGSAASRHLLHLRSADAGDATAMAATAESTDSDTQAGSQPYKLTGTLPAGQPEDQAVWRLRGADASDAEAVAAALQLDGSPTRVDGGWILRGDDDRRLAVRDDGGWTYGMDCAPDQPVTAEDLAVSCAYAVDSGTATVEPSKTDAGATGEDPVDEPAPAPSVSPGPSESDAEAAARAVFDRLGLDAAIQVYTGDPYATVQAQPTVDGLATTGWWTSLQIDADGAVVAGDGWIGDPVRDATYPVITAQKAFDNLQDQPRLMMELCMQRPDGKPGCADIPPAEVTGASLGLMLDFDGEHPVLVPAWMFDIKGQQEPATQIAVDPSFLAPPPAPEPDGGSVQPGEPMPVESGSGAGATGGATAPDAP